MIWSHIIFLDDDYTSILQNYSQKNQQVFITEYLCDLFYWQLTFYIRMVP
jgi:hypothetical protein